MTNNLSLPDLIQIVNNEERQKRDHLVESNMLSVSTREGNTYLNVPGKFNESYVLNDTARAQLATRLEIPYCYAEKLRMVSTMRYKRPLCMGCQDRQNKKSA